MDNIKNDKVLSFFNDHEESFNRLLKDLNQKKDNIIKSRLKELGIDLDPAKESKRRFKRFIVEYNDNTENYWFDDGSETGLLIVSFFKADVDVDRLGCNISTKMSYVY